MSRTSLRVLSLGVGVQSAMVLLNRVVGTASDEAALRLAQPIGVSREPVIQELKQLSELWQSARHVASAKQVGQQRRGVFRHPHLESQLARREMRVGYGLQCRAVVREAVAAIAVCAMVTLAGCGGPARSASVAPLTPAPTTAARPTPTAAVLPTPSAASSTAPAPPSPAPTPCPVPAAVPGSGARNLVATESVKAGLIAAFAAAKRLPQKQVAGIWPGDLYYGFLASTDTYWAVAGFTLTAEASFQAQVDMQDGAGTGIFSRQGGQAWTMTQAGGEPFPRSGQLPVAMMSVWNMEYWYGSCSS